jgi:hypothetical protein
MPLTLTWSHGEVPDWYPSGWNEGIVIRMSFWLRPTYETPSTVDYRKRRPNCPLLLRIWGAESEGDMLGKQTKKTWVINTVKESNVTAHDGTRSRILSMRRKRIWVTIYPD